MERHSLERHEFFEGEVFAMAGASFEHNLIVTGLLQALGAHLQAACVALPADQRLHIATTGLYTYADASVICSAPDLTTETPPALRNPEVIFEVLSESTESYDRGKKFSSYRSIPSVTDYVLLAQDQILVEHYHRQPDGSWRI